MLVTTPHSEGRYRWEGLDSIDTTATHVLFYLSKLHAVIVPARAFRNEAQFQAFVALARERWNHARSPSN
ncbi:MAG TPA: YcxB family protein [Pirellulales bacterium]|nr:YcxB family protein [Pirellulales bacterium]